MVVARDLRVSVDAARRLLERSRVLPADLDEADAQKLVAELRKLGVTCEPVSVVGRSSAVCRAHPSLAPERPCQDCRDLVCVLCTGPEGEPLCARCEERRARRTRAKWVRVGVLLTVLLSVVVWGVSRQRSRGQRLAWKRPLKVAVVVVARGELKPEVLEAWKAGVVQLEGWVAREAER